MKARCNVKTRPRRGVLATSLAVLGVALSALAMLPAYAGPGLVPSTDIYGLPITIPTYYANSPQGTWVDALGATHDSGTALRKFVDPLPGVGCTAAADFALVTNAQAGTVAAPAPSRATNTCIPIAVADTTTYPGSDYYVIGVVEYSQQLHTDLPKATALRGYTQLNNPTYPATQASATDPVSGATYTTYTAWPQPHYLGPIIVATRDRPVRVKYVNLLPTGRATFSTPPACEVITNTAAGVTSIASTDGAASFYISPGASTGAGVPADGLPHTFCEAITNVPVATARNGDLMVPNDITIRGGGLADNATGTANCPLPAGVNTMANLYPGKCLYTLNRTELHLHGGLSPWISDGTPHQWVVPAAESDPAVTQIGRHGESFFNVPDMPDPGPGAGTLYWTNQQSARLMFYHDHTSGMTRTNVYVGEAAGYVLTDPVESVLIAGGTINPPATSGLLPLPVAAGTLPGIGIPLVIEDKTFVPKDIAVQDSMWSTTQWGTYGDLWYPHVYEPNQDPTSLSGSNNAGRWDYGQWFFPPMAAASLKGPMPQPSLTPEGFMDTPTINGTAYPTVTLPASVQRFRILGVPNERTLNLSWFVADTAQPVATGVANTLTEVKMLPAVPATATSAIPSCTTNNLDATQFGGQPIPVLDSTGAPLNGNGLPVNGVTITTPTTLPGGAALPPGYNHFLQAAATNVPGTTVGTVCWPASWPVDGRDGGVPDPTLAGPAWVQIGTEGGLLPQAQVIPPTPLGYEYNRRSVTVLNAFYHGLYVGPAERVDVLVDLTAYAGKTLILYNDSPAPNPGFDPRNDYYTGDVDYTATGGAPVTAAGYGPNTRTLLQVTVSGAGTPLTGAQLTTLSSQVLPAAFAASQPAPFVGEPGFSAAFPAPAAAVANAVNATRPAGSKVPAGTFVPQYGTIGGSAITYYDGTGKLTTAAQAALPTATSPGGQPAGDLLEGIAAIHEVFDTDYGRMNAVLGYELPLTNFLTQTTVPLAYVDPTTDMLNEGETQVWKITHNGVDTHAMHFHLVNVQVVNRVGWDGTIRPPDPDEVGWKESIKMNPLEDIYVAMQAVKPQLPGFNLPDSSRRLDPTQPIGGTANFTNPPGGEFPYIPAGAAYGLSATAQTNIVANFGWEYVWHCHLLGHEENDMMRPLVMQVTSVIPASPAPATATPAVLPAHIVLHWVDGTPFVWSTAAGATIPPATTANMGNPANEVGFHIYRVALGYPATPPAAPTALSAYALVANGIANSTTWTDPNQVAGYYAYAVTAWNQAGESAPAFTGTVLLTGPVAKMALSVGTLAFGNVQTGQSVSQNVTVTNTGTGGALLLLGAVTPPNAFYSSSNNCPAAGIAVGASCTLTLTFAPTGAFATGGVAQNGAFSISSNASNAPLPVTVTGNAWPPVAAALPATLAFGVSEIGVPKTLSVTIRNTGYGPWYPAPAPAFVNDGVAGYSLGAGGTCSPTVMVAVGGSCVTNISFNPTAVGAVAGVSATLSETAYTGATAAGPQQTVTESIPLSGTGALPVATVTPAAAFAFGTLPVGTRSTAHVWTVTNTGTVTITFAPFTLGGANASQFASATTCPAAPAALAVGGTCTVSVTFAPTVNGAAAATLPIVSGTTTFATLAPSGTGVTVSATLTPATVAYGTVNVGATSPATTFTYANTGTVAINVGTVVSSNVADFVLTNAGAAACTAGKALAPAASCTFTVAFRPASAGAKAATVTASATSAFPVPNATASLTGTGNGVVTPPAINLGAAYNFGRIPNGGTGTTHAFTLSNTGGSALVIRTIAIAKTNGGAGVYTIAAGGTCAIGATVAAGGSCTVNVNLVEPVRSITTATLTVSGVQSGTTTPTYTATNAITGR